MDNGIGIPESARSKIFEPFFTTKAPGDGTGLGLAISRRIIEAHNGTLTFESNSNRGTTFSIQLPVADTANVYPFRHSAAAQ